MDNASLAALFDELADLLEISGDNPFKTRAYRAFARVARVETLSLEGMAARGALQSLPGVGKAIAAKVDAAAHTGTFPALDRARAAIPECLRRLREQAPELGPKALRAVWKGAGIETLGELAHACEENRLAHVKGVGRERQAVIHEAVRGLLERSGGTLLGAALAVSRTIEARLLEAGAADAQPLGDVRRGEELVQALAIVTRGVTPEHVAACLDGCEALGGARVTATVDGATLVALGVPVRVRVVSDAEWVHRLLIGTGDEAHLAWLDARAGGRLAEACVGAAREEDVYRALGLPAVPPELRRGEVYAVDDALVRRADVRGFFHVHTDWSDGTSPVLAMAQAALRGGFHYLGISDHSRAASYANGLDAGRLKEQALAIVVARREADRCTIFHGVEVDILEDGSLDLDDEVLASLDFVIASVHTRLAMTHDEMTARLVRAVSHPLVTILGHPTGRLLLARKGYSFDLEAVARAAAANDTYLEINANAQRLDLNDVLVRRAAATGARFAIDPDAHADHGVDETALGVVVARRAGLRRDQVLNARDRDEITAVLAARKARALLRLATSR